jgi:hypothetical protein
MAMQRCLCETRTCRSLNNRAGIDAIPVLAEITPPGPAEFF